MARLNHLIQVFREKSHHDLSNRIKSWAYSPDTFYHFIWYHYWADLINSCYGQSKQLKHFDRIAHEGLIREFQQLDGQCSAFAQESLVKILHEELPCRHAAGEMEIVRREIEKRRRWLPVRKLLEQAGAAVQKTKPVFMMSPMSVATYLPPGKIEFDLVIFDEASQLTTEDSMGALARAKQAVVVGDSKQMPPSDFFSRSIEVDDEELEENVTAEIESILGLFSAQGAPEKMLQWHYRSKHDSLIFTSNQEFYSGRLKAFPNSGTLLDTTGLEMIHLPHTVYDQGLTRTNKEEAKEVATAVLDHARNYSHLSLGVVAFSMAQKEALLVEIEYLRRQHPELEAFFNSALGNEPFFVKNLENVQGDQRDVIFISIGYGKNQYGKIMQNFGPVNNPGGERRLNVLISRAKNAMKVFCNFTADDLKTEAKSPFGLRVLKTFLKYAQTNEYSLPQETEREMDSPFETAVYDAVRGLGYEVVPQVGSQGFFIDLAVRDPRQPGRYLLAIECDGASYHSSVNARDRDRLRQAVLEDRGWKFHRIWSTDWFRNPSQEIQRIHDHIEKELSRSETHSHQNPVSKPEPQINRIKGITDTPATELYQTTVLPPKNWSRFSDFSQIPAYEIHVAIKKILETESPVAIKAITNRLTNAAGLSRAGSRIQNRVTLLLQEIASRDGILIQGDFATLPTVGIKVRNRRDVPSGEKCLDFVAPQEIQKGILDVTDESLSISPSDCFSEVSSRLGFQRVTAQMNHIFQQQLDALVTTGKICFADGRLSLTKKQPES